MKSIIAPFIQTNSGQKVHLLAPCPHTIHLHDIAHSLSHSTRYMGHTDKPYFIAEHSVKVFQWVEVNTNNRKAQCQALMHDSPEFAIGDMVKPLKELIGEPFKKVERVMWAAICRRFDLANEWFPICKEADLRILMNEKAAGFSRDVEWGWSAPPLEDTEIEFWDSERCYLEFMSAAEKLGIK